MLSGVDESEAGVTGVTGGTGVAGVTGVTDVDLVGNTEMLVVTGMSGAGKTQAMKSLEDLDFFCIDNLPPQFLPQLAQLAELAAERGQRFAVAMDARSREMFDDLGKHLDELDAAGVKYRVLFLDCSDDVLVRRYSETRRRHPVSGGRSLFEQIAAERRLLAGIRDRADLVLDTTRMTSHDMKGRLAQMVAGKSLEEGIEVDVMSFGFKHGVPLDSDLVFDVRFLPNPYYDLDLRPQTGLDAPVRDYVLGSGDAEEYVEDIVSFVRRWLKSYAATGRPRLTVAIGCTGGQHRSVAIAESIVERLKGEHANIGSHHRDMPRRSR